MESKHPGALQKEREKLSNLIDAALANGTPIKEARVMDQCMKIKRMVIAEKLSGVLRREEIIRQSRRVDRMIARMEEER